MSLFSVMDHCHDKPCQNNGTCINDLDNYSCACPAKFTGKDCEGVQFFLSNISSIKLKCTTMQWPLVPFYNFLFSNEPLLCQSLPKQWNLSQHFGELHLCLSGGIHRTKLPRYIPLEVFLYIYECTISARQYILPYMGNTVYISNADC